MCLRNDVRGYYILQYDVFRQACDDVFVLFPTASCQKDFFSRRAEFLNLRKSFGILRNLCHSVESGISADTYVFVACRLEKFRCLFVLNEEVFKHFQSADEPLSVRLKKVLVGTKDKRNLKYPPTFQGFEIIIPKLVFHKERKTRIGVRHEFAGIAFRIVRQVNDPFCKGIVLTYLVAGGRIKRKKNFMVRITGFQCLDQRSPLLEFSK